MLLLLVTIALHYFSAHVPVSVCSVGGWTRTISYSVMYINVVDGLLCCGVVVLLLCCFVALLCCCDDALLC